MLARELMGASVEVAAPGFAVTDPLIDRPLPSGGGHVVAASARAIVRVPEVGTFAIADGERIQFAPKPGVKAGVVSMWLHGTVASLLLAQRGRFALHASVVAIGGRSVALTGARRAGKSTTALRLGQRGHELVTDDVSPLECDGSVTVHPFARPVHVFPQTADSLGLDVSEAGRLFDEHPKLALPPPRRAAVELEAVVVLRVDAEADATIGSDRLRGAHAHWSVATNVYRVELLGGLCQAEMFEWAGAVASKVPVYAVSRPGDGWTVDEVADAVEAIARDHS
jgi:hypothetical protein